MEWLQNLDLGGIVAILTTISTIVAAVIAVLEKLRNIQNSSLLEILIEAIEGHSEEANTSAVKKAVYDRAATARKVPEMAKAVAGVVKAPVAPAPPKTPTKVGK